MSNFSTYELLIIHYAFDPIEGAAKGHMHQTGAQIVQDMAAFLQKNPNATDHQLAGFLGCDDSLAAIVRASVPPYFPAHSESLKAAVDFLNSTLPVLPNRPTKTPGFDAIIFLSMALMIIVVAARLYSRLKIMTGLLLTDYAIIAGSIITLFFSWICWINYTFVVHTLGFWHMTPQTNIMMKQFSFSLWLIALVMLWTIKVSLLLFYYQLTNWRPLRVAVWIAFGIISASTIGGFFGYIFMCNPSLYWTVPLPKCLPKGAIFLMMSGFTNVLTDVAIWMIPIPLLWKLSVPRKDRNWAVAIFGLGLLPCAAGAVKLAMIYQGWLGRVTFEDSGGGVVTLFANLEPLFGIICASLPSLRPLARRYAPGLVSNADTIIECDVIKRKNGDAEALATGSEVPLHLKPEPLVLEHSHGSTQTSTHDL